MVLRLSDYMYRAGKEYLHIIRAGKSSGERRAAVDTCLVSSNIGKAGRREGK